MKKLKQIGLLVTIVTILFSCGNDDSVDDNFIPARDRAEEAPASTAIIEEYLETHFYNYENSHSFNKNTLNRMFQHDLFKE